MDVRVLGPLQVEDSGRSIAFGGPRQRAVLALLALHANQVVPTGRLVVELWGEDAPPRAANALQVAVLRLRQALPEGRLITRTPGYLLRVAPDELDIGRFERLLTDGREALAAGAAMKAARTLRLALSLWRGPALADFRYEPFAQAEIVRLEELRLVCLEERIKADLSLGAAGEVVGELQCLVAEQPLRERLRGQLMLALYRSGRQAEALEAYREFRELLVEELGLEPAPVLRQLEAAILRHDPALTALSAAASAPARKPLTVLCAELRVASGPAASVDPEALGGVHGRALAVLAATLERYGGKLAAAAGERVLGVFGINVLHEDDALRAAQATLAARDALHAEAISLERERGLGLSMRFGLATGEALVGGPEPPGFAGDAVAQAIDLAGSAEPGEILLSEETHRLAAAALEVEVAGPGQVRLRRAATGARPLPVRLDASLIGRNGELGRLRETFARVRRERAPVLVIVLGEAGIGKTRLAHELTASLAGQATVLTGRCLPYGDGITFWPLRELVRQAGAPEGTRDQLERLLSDQADATSVAEQLAGALGASGQGTSPAAIFGATRRLLQALAQRRPLLVILEDLHWAEPTFLDLVESLVAQAPDEAAPAALLLLCLARPELLERRPGWATSAVRADVLQLQPLADDAATALLEALARPQQLPASEQRRLLEAAGGNPLFLEQLVVSLAEQRLGRDSPLLPPTIQALLAARLELLGPAEQAVLARAAVLGRDFWSEGVAELLPEDARLSLRRHLQALVAKELVQSGPSRDRAEEDFRFRHILIQQAAYRAIPKSLRADLHERFAGWLERRAGERASQYDEILGYHLEQAVRYRGELAPADERTWTLARRAAGYLEVAGSSAYTRGDALAAVNLLKRATALLPQDDRVVPRLLTASGTALIEAGQLDQAADTLEAAQRLAAAAGDERQKAHALVQRLLLGLQVDLRRATAEVGQILPGVMRVFKRHADQLGLCRAWRLQAAVHWNQANSAAAEHAWQKAAIHARRAGDQRELVDILGWLASAALWGPTPAAEGIRRCETYLAQVGSHPTGEAEVLLHLGGLYAMQDRVDEARAVLARGNAILDDLGPTMTSAITEPAAFVAMLTGDPAAAELHLRRDYESLRRMGEKEHLATTAALLAQAIMAQGQERHDAAERYIAVSREAGAGEDVSAQIVGQGVLAGILAARGRLAEAEELARAAVGLAEQTDLLSQHGDALLDLAQVLDAAGHPRAARAAVSQAFDLYQRKGNLLAAQHACQRLEQYAHP